MSFLPDLSGWPLSAVIGVFLAAAAVITFGGMRMVRVSDRLADLTGLGEALFGAVFLAGSNSLGGVATSVTAAAAGHADLAVGAAIGGIAVQTAFLAIADVAYRRANLEHAAASLPNIIQAALCSTLLGLTIVGITGPSWTAGHVHPLTLLLPLGWLAGMRLVSHSRQSPMWGPRRTPETRIDMPDEEPERGKGTARLWVQFAVLAVVLAGSGAVVAQAGITISERTGLTETVVGVIFVAVVNSMPELVTAVAAVRRGALTLAVGDIVGGNAFDVLTLALADLFYLPGSIYHAVPRDELFFVALTLVLVNVLLLGLLRRQRHGWGGIGFESALILAIYAGSVLLLVLT